MTEDPVVRIKMPEGMVLLYAMVLKVGAPIVGVKSGEIIIDVEDREHAMLVIAHRLGMIS